ncbi:uncharacterized protein LOC113299891 [Papaver somniferum]|uniref:uncharacterized protein LOC113299891 n=1 Tax=Papaver somniferum TaxID=3469 RepID=UPI000E701641|nr:uncharacterized protein LOC113299891 [Papaver somniferum]
MQKLRLSGISGKINKPAEKDLTHGLDGIAVCTFKQKIHKHDTVFMHVYQKVEVPRFFNPIMRGPEPLDRIWHGVVDAYELTRASNLCVPADMDSFYKRHINPFDTRDLEFHSRWPQLMVAQRRAISEEEKLSIKRQIEDLEILRDERRRERESEALSRRWQTLEQLRVVRIIENQKKPEDINKQLPFLEDDQNSLRLMIEGFIKKYKEYVKGKAGMPTGDILPSPSSAAGFQVSHATTCLSINNISGLYFMADGRVTTTYPHYPEDYFEIVADDRNKIHFVGNRVLVSASGDCCWCDLFIWIFRREIEHAIATADETAEERSAFWTVERCAGFVQWFQNVGFEAPFLPPDTHCAMIFGSYENFEARMFFANKEEVHEIFNAELPTGHDRLWGG